MGLTDMFKQLNAATAAADKAVAQANQATAQANQASAQAYSDAERAKIRNNAVQVDDDVEGEENIEVHGEGEDARIVRQSGEADLVEEDGEVQWVDRVDADIPRNQWVDEWGPLKDEGSRLEDFCYHEYLFDKTRAGDPDAAEQKLLSFGYQNVGHFFRVRNTILKYFARSVGPKVSDAIIDSQEYQNTYMRASQRADREDGNAFLEANKQLMDPVEGISFELYARVIAKQAAQTSQADLNVFLAKHGTDMATFTRASGVWEQRMASDTTGTLTTRFSELFMAGGEGAHGDAGAAGAAASFTGGMAPGGDEPMPFEQFCEMSGATTAWAVSGLDVNPLMQQRFGISANDFTNISSWWMAKMTTELSLLAEYNTKRVEYEQQYKGSLPNASEGISF